MVSEGAAGVVVRLKLRNEHWIYAGICERGLETDPTFVLHIGLHDASSTIQAGCAGWSPGFPFSWTTRRTMPAPRRAEEDGSVGPDEKAFE